MQPTARSRGNASPGGGAASTQDIPALRRLPLDTSAPQRYNLRPLAVGVCGVMAGVWWMIGRRMKLAEEAARSAMIAEDVRQGPSEPARSPEKDDEK